MRELNNKSDISVHAIAGTYTVLLNMDAKNGLEKGLLGFAIRRDDHTEDERSWMKGFLTFEKNASSHAPGTLVSTYLNPIQAFKWGDYTAKPGHRYTYLVVPVRGTPDNLTYDQGISVTVSTEDEDSGEHTVFFNRGAAGSQAYARKFGNVAPDKVGPPAFEWLSRGLVEGMAQFINQAQGPGWGLYASVYEFTYIPILKEFARARSRGVDVRIVFDNKEKGPGAANKKAMQEANITPDFATERNANPSYISHNKFILLLKDGKPVQVWTGSTNITEGGIYGHSNVGHIVRNETVASAYYAYWKELSQDPDAKKLRPYNESHSPLPKDDAPRAYINPVFSSRSSLAALQWYAKKMDEAKQGVFLTAAFGISDEFQKVLEVDKPYLRYILLDKPGQGLDVIKRDKDNMIAVGGVLNDNALDTWLGDKWKAEALTGLNQHVQYIHTKYMIIDPLGDDPLLITGSANFSKNSTVNNDENMLVIRGNTRVVDTYLGEFMRLFDHYQFRGTEVGPITGEKTGKTFSLNLAADDSWTRNFFNDGHPKTKEKLLFRGY